MNIMYRPIYVYTYTYILSNSATAGVMAASLERQQELRSKKSPSRKWPLHLYLPNYGLSVILWHKQ